MIALNTDLPIGTLVTYAQRSICQGQISEPVEQAGTWEIVGTARGNRYRLRDTEFRTFVEVYAENVHVVKS